MTDQTAHRAIHASLTPALEDYLETIYRLVAKAGSGFCKPDGILPDCGDCKCPGLPDEARPGSRKGWLASLDERQ